MREDGFSIRIQPKGDGIQLGIFDDDGGRIFEADLDLEAGWTVHDALVTCLRKAGNRHLRRITGGEN